MQLEYYWRTIDGRILVSFEDGYHDANGKLQGKGTFMYETIEIDKSQVPPYLLHDDGNIQIDHGDTLLGWRAV